MQSALLVGRTWNTSDLLRSNQDLSRVSSTKKHHVLPLPEVEQHSEPIHLRKPTSTHCHPPSSSDVAHDRSIIAIRPTMATQENREDRKRQTERETDRGESHGPGGLCIAKTEETRRYKVHRSDGNEQRDTSRSFTVRVSCREYVSREKMGGLGE